MTRVLVLDVPAPCKFINANDRPHWRKKADLTAAWREAGRKAIQDLDARSMAPLPFEGRVRVLAHIWKQRRGLYDPNNLNPTTKAILDGIVDAGVLIDDSFTYVDGPDHRHGGYGQPRIVFTIEEAP